MNELGVALDLSHANSATAAAAMKASVKPVLMTHGGCAAVHPHPRNKTDAELRALAGSRSSAEASSAIRGDEEESKLRWSVFAGCSCLLSTINKQFPPSRQREAIGRFGHSVGLKYSVRNDVLPENVMPCVTPAGAQIAQRGGTTQEPCVVQTVITPLAA